MYGFPLPRANLTDANLAAENLKAVKYYTEKNGLQALIQKWLELCC